MALILQFEEETIICLMRKCDQDVMRQAITTALEIERDDLEWTDYMEFPHEGYDKDQIV